MEVKQLYVAWQDSQDRSWCPVGILTVDENNIYRFVYTKGAQRSKFFVPFGRMKDLDTVYESEDLFPLFTNRLLSNSRPEYGKYLEWLDVKQDDDNPFGMLAITEGIRGTDTLEVFKCPTPNSRGEYEVLFLSHGLRHLPKSVIERVNSLTKGDRLFLLSDMQNKFHSMAMALRTDDPVEVVGYCPRYLSPDFCYLLENNNTADVVVSVERINVDAPLNLRLMCRVVAPWPKDFEPCSADAFAPMIDYQDVVKDIEAGKTLATV